MIKMQNDDFVIVTVLNACFLTESSKFPASIAKSNKQMGGELLASGGVQVPSDKLGSSDSGNPRGGLRRGFSKNAR